MHVKSRRIASVVAERVFMPWSAERSARRHGPIQWLVQPAATGHPCVRPQTSGNLSTTNQTKAHSLRVCCSLTCTASFMIAGFNEWHGLQERVPLCDSGMLHCLVHDQARHFLAAGASNGDIHVHTLEGWQALSSELTQLPVLEGHSAEVVGLAILSSGLIVSASADRSVRVWDLSVMKQLAVSDNPSTNAVLRSQVCQLPESAQPPPCQSRSTRS